MKRPFKPVLGPKKRYNHNNGPVRKVWKSIKMIVPRWWADRIVHDASVSVQHHMRMSARNSAANVRYGWSGGKDSLALQIVMRAAGLEHRGLLCHSDLDFDLHKAWTAKHKPPGCTVIDAGLDIEWLKRNKQYLWSKTTRDGSTYQMIHHVNPMKKHMTKEGVMLFVTGRRRQDINYISDPGVRLSTGYCVFDPIADWIVEEIMAVIAWNRLKLPPAYDFVNGWYDGTPSWNGRTVKSDDHGWAETYDIDPDLVRWIALHHARDFPGAVKIVKERNHAQNPIS